MLRNIAEACKDERHVHRGQSDGADDDNTKLLPLEAVDPRDILPHLDLFDFCFVVTLLSLLERRRERLVSSIALTSVGSATTYLQRFPAGGCNSRGRKEMRSKCSNWRSRRHGCSSPHSAL